MNNPLCKEFKKSWSLQRTSHDRFLFLDTDIQHNFFFTLLSGLGLKLASDLKQNSYIRSTAKDARKMVRFLVPLQKVHDSFCYTLYKSQIRLKIEYCCHIWVGASQFSLSSLGGAHKRLRGLVGDKLFSTLQILS